MPRLIPAVALALLLPAAAVPAAPLNVDLAQPLADVRVQEAGAGLAQAVERTAEGEALRRLTFQPGAHPALVLMPEAGVWDWRGVGALGLRLQNAMDWALTLEVTLESADGQQLRTQIALPSGPVQELRLPLTASSARQHGMRAAPPMPWQDAQGRILQATEVQGQLDLSRVRSLTLALPAPGAAQAVLLGQLQTLPGRALDAAWQNLVDEYGQYRRLDWPQKISSDDQLRSAQQAEAAQRQQWLASLPAQDVYGGLQNGPALRASGFFRTEKRDGRWLLVSPLGHPFFSLGVNAVSASQNASYVSGRESMFAAQPAGSLTGLCSGSSQSGAQIGASRGLAFRSGRWVDHYCANLLRSQLPAGCASASCQPAVLKDWAGRSVERLRAWGFNTLGNWSDAGVTDLHRMPYTLPLSIAGDFATVSTGADTWGAMPDPFDPRFAAAAQRSVQQVAASRRGDPWLLGYFADNELAWAGGGDAAQSRWALARSTLRGQTQSPARQFFVASLRQQYGEVAALNRAWGVNLADWAALERGDFIAPLPDEAHPALTADYQQFQQQYADRYFQTVAQTLKAVDPDHLLLGGRFAASIPEAVQACARWCDVLSFNFYTREPQHGHDFAALRALDKPLLIGEFHFGSRDRGAFWGGLQEVWTEAQRGEAYALYLQRALQEPQIVGLHWFQYLDQPVTGRLLDGENGHVGLVGITDLPWNEFVPAVRAANLALLQKLGAAGR